MRRSLLQLLLWRLLQPPLPLLLPSPLLQRRLRQELRLLMLAASGWRRILPPLPLLPLLPRRQPRTSKRPCASVVSVFVFVSVVVHM